MLQALRSVRDPLLVGTSRLCPDVVSQGLVQGVEVDERRRTVAIAVELPTPAHAAKGALTWACAAAAETVLPWDGAATATEVTFSAAEPRYRVGVREQGRIAKGSALKEGVPAVPPALKNVGAIIAVASCKVGLFFFSGVNLH